MDDMMQRAHHRIERCMAWVTVVGALALILYWTAYLVNPVMLVGEDPAIRAFESAFPIADGGLVVLLLTTSCSLFAHRRQGAVLLVAAGAAAIYLGLLDTTFYAGRGLYAARSPAALVELVINALCLGGGGLAVGVGWALWRSP
jgi:hypothetical protein